MSQDDRNMDSKELTCLTNEKESNSYGAIVEESDKTNVGKANEGYVPDDAEAQEHKPNDSVINTVPNGTNPTNNSTNPDDADLRSIAPLVSENKDGGSGDSPGDSASQKEAVGKPSEEYPDEPWWRILLETTGPFVLAGFGLMGAGVLLGIIQV